MFQSKIFNKFIESEDYRDTRE